MNDVTEIRVRMSDPDRTRTVPAAPTPVPGLYVARLPWGFAVVHARSGLSIGYYESPEAALGCATDLGGIHDWTLPATSLKDLPGYKHAAIVMARVRWQGRKGARPVTLEDLPGT